MWLFQQCVVAQRNKINLLIDGINDYINNRWNYYVNNICFYSVTMATCDRILIIPRLYTQRNLFEVLLNQTKITSYLPLTDWFGTKRTHVWFQNIRKMVNTIWFRFDLIGFRKYFSVCANTSAKNPAPLPNVLWLN